MRAIKGSGWGKKICLSVGKITTPKKTRRSHPSLRYFARTRDYSQLLVFAVIAGVFVVHSCRPLRKAKLIVAYIDASVSLGVCQLVGITFAPDVKVTLEPLTAARQDFNSSTLLCG